MDSEKSSADAAEPRHRYTVLVLYPGYISDNEAPETYAAWVVAEGAEEAIRSTQMKAARANMEYVDAGEGPEQLAREFAPLAVFPGWLQAEWYTQDGL